MERLTCAHMQLCADSEEVSFFYRQGLLTHGRSFYSKSMQESSFVQKYRFMLGLLIVFYRYYYR